MAAFCLPLCLHAQQNKLSISHIELVTVKRGASVTQTLKVEVQPGLHVNSDKPKDEYIIPLKLTWTQGPLEAVSISYPKAEEIKVGEETLTVFTGTFPIKTQFKASAQAAAGDVVMLGKLHYQACNNQMCFRPMTLDVRLPVVVQ